MCEREIENLLFEIISKKAQIILNTDNTDDFSNIPLHMKQQSEYEKRINLLREEKCQLYERYVLGTITAEAYKAEKSVIDTELNRLNQAYASLKLETAVMVASKNSDDEIRRIAESASGESKLNKALVELLIDKIYVYPGNRIEIMWKVADFFAATGGF